MTSPHPPSTLLANRWRLLCCLFAALIPLLLSANESQKIRPDFAALAKQASVTLPPPPAWVPANDAATWTVDDLQRELARVTDTPPKLNTLRTRLLRPPHRWAVDFKKWFSNVQKELKIEFRNQLWDCDDYANCFVAFADLLAMKAADTRGDLCIGWATVYYRRAFAGIRAGGAHAVVIIGTDEGLFVLEPQDGTIVPLGRFPNRHTIEELHL